MRWSKIKNIIILLLVIVNVSLLGMVGLRYWRSERNQRETRQRLIAVMARNEITFLPAEVPGDLTLPGVRVTLEPPGEAEAQILVGPEPVGTSTVGARTTWSGERGTVILSAAGEVEAQWKAGAWPSEGDPGEQSLDLLAQLGVTARESGREETGGRTVIHCVQLWNGAPVPGWTAAFTWGSQGLEHLSLRRLAGTEEPISAGEETIDAATALARFLEALSSEGYVCSQVTDLYAGYAAGGTGTVTLTPTWYVETDTQPWRFAVDGYTGAVTIDE